jgi:hypothetical protein
MSNICQNNPKILGVKIMEYFGIIPLSPWDYYSITVEFQKFPTISSYMNVVAEE